jgi:hypothetical protein
VVQINNLKGLEKVELPQQSPKKRGRPLGAGVKYNFDQLAPGENMDVPYINKNSPTSVLHSAKSWAKRRGLKDARFITLTYRSIGVVRIFRRR